MPNPNPDEPLTEAGLAALFAEEGREQAAAEAEQPPAEPETPEAETPPLDPEPPVVIPPEKQDPTDPDPTPEPSPLIPPEAHDPALEQEVFTQPEFLAWAERRQLTTFEDVAKLAYEQERFLGRRATELQELREKITELEAAGPSQQPTAARSEEWIASAIASPDPGRYAYELAQAGEWEAYQRLMETWEEVVGQTITMNVHRQIQGVLEQQQAEAVPVEPTAPDPDRIREAFALAGIFDLDTHPLRPTIIMVADEMGGDHPLVQGAAQGDPMAVGAIVEIARSRTLTTRTLRMDGSEVDPRQAAAGITGNGAAPLREPAKPDPFAKLDEEWKRMGVLPTEG